jgi:precorrin-6B C5,15-methyltransferase / cobalt-precorrin-6B C5,C15-methyltransferase
MMEPIHVIGIGQGKQDLTPQQMERIRTADVLVGGRRHLSLFAGHSGEALVLDRHLDRIIEIIKDRMKQCKVVVLASGDPLFYGIGATLITHIDKQFLRIHPNVSSVAAAFAAIKEPWHDAKIISLHSRPLPDFSFADLVKEKKVAFLTSPSADPVFIARNLCRRQISGFRFCVLENLGDPDREKILWFDSPGHVPERPFSHPNVVILLRQAEFIMDDVSHETHPGMADDRFTHANGLITKSEIRSIVLSKLKLTKKDHVLWDIGSGSGSVAIEAALAIPEGVVVAIEKNPSRLPDIVHNIKQFHCPNILVKHMDFPAGAEFLPRPDRIFVGGGGSRLDTILDTAGNCLVETGFLVVNTVLIQSMAQAFDWLDQNRFNPEMIQVQISRSRAMPYGTRLDALNPVWIVSGTKPKQ